MRLFLQAGDVREAREGLRLAVFAGLVTSPALPPVDARGDYGAVVRELAALSEGPLLAHLPYADLDHVREQATDWLADIATVVPGVPVGAAALPLIAALTDDGAQVCGSGVATVAQGLLAASAGAAFVSVPLAQAAGAGIDPIGLIDDLARLFEFYNLPCQIVADGLDGAEQLAAAAKAGAHAATLAAEIARLAAGHPATVATLIPAL